MDENKEIANNVPDAFNTSNTTIVEHERVLYQALQRQLKRKAKENQLANTKVLKKTHENVTKRLKIKQNAWIVT